MRLHRHLSTKRWGAAQMLISLNHALQLFLMRPISTIAIWVIGPNQIRIACAQRLAIGIHVEAQRLQGAPILRREKFSIRPFARHGCFCPAPKARGNGIQGIMKIGPSRRPIHPCCRAKGPAFLVPPAHRHLCALNVFPAHPRKEVIARVKGTDMIEAQPLPLARPIGSRRRAGWIRRAKLPRLRTAGPIARAGLARHAAMKSVVPPCAAVAHSARQRNWS